MRRRTNKQKRRAEPTRQPYGGGDVQADFLRALRAANILPPSTSTSERAGKSAAQIQHENNVADKIDGRC